MNQIVTDVLVIDYHTIDRTFCGDTGVWMWAVNGHGKYEGDKPFMQIIDYYNDLALAQKDYPKAWCTADQTGILDDFDWPSDTIPQ